MHDDAQTIAQALIQLQPDSEQPLIVKAIVQLNSNDAAGAVRTLQDQALQINPGNAMAKTFLGLALEMEGRGSERDRVLNEVVVSGKDESAVSLAKDLLAG